MRDKQFPSGIDYHETVRFSRNRLYDARSAWHQGIGKKWYRSLGLVIDPERCQKDRDYAEGQRFIHQKEYEALLDAASWEHFGRAILPTDYRISGIWQDGFREDYKERLRTLVRLVQFFKDIARLNNELLTFKQGKIRDFGRQIN